MPFGKSKVAYSDSSKEPLRWDSDLNRMDADLQQNTTVVVRRVRQWAADYEVSSYPLWTLSLVLDSIVGPIGGADAIILQFENSTFEDPDFADFVKGYSDNTQKILNFCNEVKKCLNNALNSQFDLGVALGDFEKKIKVEGCFDGYERIREALEKFKAEGNPFTDDFSNSLKSFYDSLVLWLEDLQSKKKKLDKKIKKNKALRTVANVMFVVACASVLVCSVLVTALVSAPVAVAAIGAAAALPVGPLADWINSWWDKREIELIGQSDIMGELDRWTTVGKLDLGTIKFLVTDFGTEIESMLRKTDCAIGNEAAVIPATEELKKNLSVVRKIIEDLSQSTDNCTKNVREGRNKILEKIKEYPKK